MKETIPTIVTRMTAYTLAIIIALTSVNSIPVLAEETVTEQIAETEESVTEETENSVKVGENATTEEPVETNEIEQTDELGQEETVEPTNYSISFKELRGDGTTWIFQDEVEYYLGLNTENLDDKDNIAIQWSFDNAELENCYTIADDEKSISLNGVKLSQKGLIGNSFTVKAEVIADGMNTGSIAETVITVENSEVSLTEDISGDHHAGTEWIYENNSIEAYVKNELHPLGETCNLKIDEIVSSNEKVMKATYYAYDKQWRVSAVQKGSAIVTYKVSDELRSYTFTKAVNIYCEHKISAGMMQARQLVEQARGWMGKNESDGSHKEIIDIYNSHTPLAIGYKVTYTDSWCATFVSAASIACGFTDIVPTECGCERMIKLFQNIESWHENENCTPETGWIIFYDWQDSGEGDNTGWADHVGVVEKVENKEITVIEGNYDDSVKRRTIQVNAPQIRGYAIPKYGKILTKATVSKNGSIVEKCAFCNDYVVENKVIYAASKMTLSTTNYTYDGKVKTPSVTVKDSKGNKLVSGKDYTVSYASGRKDVGKYAVKITLKGNYTGSQTLYFSINPKAPSSVKAVLSGGHDDVKITWSKCSYVKGYVVYYKYNGSNTYKKLASTTKCTYTAKNLADGKQYTFKIVPYFVSGGKNVESNNTKTVSIYTLKKISKPTVKKYSSSKIKISWTNIPGETGYQISRSTSKYKTNTVATVSSSYSSKVLKVTRNRTYYYKVRAYKTVDGKRIYGPWSDVRSYKLK